MDSIIYDKEDMSKRMYREQAFKVFGEYICVRLEKVALVFTDMNGRRYILC